MNIFGIGLPEMAVIAAIGLLVFGPKRLPELGKTLGRTLKGFQSASREFEQEFRRAVDSETVVAETLAAESLASAEAASTDASIGELAGQAGDSQQGTQATTVSSVGPEAPPLAH
ncbi:MAG: TatA/E family twin arginine-targeting protein translocase [Prochlorococcaceae cyanobacterium]